MGNYRNIFKKRIISSKTTINQLFKKDQRESTYRDTITFITLGNTFVHYKKILIYIQIITYEFLSVGKFSIYIQSLHTNFMYRFITYGFRSVYNSQTNKGGLKV